MQYRFENSGFKGDFDEIFVPAEEVIERKDGKERITERKFYPSYLFVRMHMCPETWQLDQPGARWSRASSAIPTSAALTAPGAKWKEPTPLPDSEIEKIRGPGARALRQARARRSSS